MKRNNFKEKYRHKKFKRHNLVLQILGFFIIVLIAIVISPALTGKKIDTETSNQNVTGNSLIQKCNYKYNPNTKQLLAEFWIGDQENLNSLADEKDLSNIKYATRALLANTSSQVTSKSYKINNHFLVIELKNINPKFGVIEIDILPEVDDKNIQMNDFQKNNFNKFFIKENKVTLLQDNLFKSRKVYQTDYQEFMIANYQELISRKQKIITKANATIARDQSLIANLENKKAQANKSEEVEIKNQINDYKSDIESINETKRQAQAVIHDANENINSIRGGVVIQ